MRQVTLTRDVRPWRAGDHPILPDEAARILLQTGEATDPRPWPPVPTHPVPADRLPADAAPAAAAKPPIGHYLTRGKRR